MEEEIVEEILVDEEVYTDEEVRLPGISEEEEDDDVHDELEEYFHESSVYSVTEVELDEEFSEVLEEEGTEVEEVEEIVDVTVGATDGDSEVDEVTLREEDLAIAEANYANGYQVTMPNFPVDSDITKPTASTDDEETAPGDIDDDEEDDGVSSEELAEAIEYILRQEKAVSRFILTEDQAHTMMTLPRKVMKVIVDHLETCDNDGTEIDWDFLLKIVLPFCTDSATSDDDTDGGEDAIHCIPCSTSTGAFCLPINNSSS